MNETPETTSPQWLLSRDGKKYGPMTPGQLTQLCQTGKISPADLICRAGSDRWTPAGEVRGLFPPTTQASEVVTDAPIRPVEEATTSVSNAADAYWKSVGSFVCIANLAACGVFGLVKSPPAIVQDMDNMRDEFDRNQRMGQQSLLEAGFYTIPAPSDPQQDREGADEALQNIKPRPVIEDAIRKGDVPNIPSIPRIPGVR